MRHLFEMIKKKNLWIDIFNLSTGIILVVAIILFSLFPENKVTVVLIFGLTGIMNLSNGIKKYKVKSTRSTGMIFITISMITFFAAAMFLTASK